jgi:hypothetical protein
MGEADDRFLQLAWSVMQTDISFRSLDASMRMFWFRAVLDIHESGDGRAICFGNIGNRYRSLAQFLDTHEQTEDSLRELLQRGFLAEPELGVIAIPAKFRLPFTAVAAPPERMRFVPKVVKGGRS